MKMFEQKKLSFDDEGEYGDIHDYIIKYFSHNDFYSVDERLKGEEKYATRLEILEGVDRRAVSFQMSKNDNMHGWLKYREGFSASLVNLMIDRMNLSAGSCILDPFFGSGTTGLAAGYRGINSVGFDILPISKISIAAKKEATGVDIPQLEKLIDEIERLKIPDDFMGKINSVRITDGAYPDGVERKLAYISFWIDKMELGKGLRQLMLLGIVNSLENVSYTRKDGQYLRWDYRSRKIYRSNKRKHQEESIGKKNILNKGDLPDIYLTISSELRRMRDDIICMKKNNMEIVGDVAYYEESVLKKLPTFDDDYFDGVITSPPYCNRYDYTRTYALELAYMGLDSVGIKNLRQTLLSCTVENKSKIEWLRQYYSEIGKMNRFHDVMDILESSRIYVETMSALRARAMDGYLNNRAVVNMVSNYFVELCFVYYEIYRTNKNGSKIFFVNDNVRYAGEVIPVDTISSDFAERIGFAADKIYCIKQRKGNSSQQMKNFGRVALRKSITEWTVEK